VAGAAGAKGSFAVWQARLPVSAVTMARAWQSCKAQVCGQGEV